MKKSINNKVTFSYKKEENPNNLRNWIILYTDMILRGLIAFFFAGICLYTFLVGYLHIKAIYILPIAFIVSIMISPFLSRIRLGNFVLNSYEKWLNNLILKWKK
jgi:hypothetical protein